MNAYFPAEEVEIVYSGDDFFEKLERLIEDAKVIIHLQTYIFDEDATGKRIAEKLILAVNRGVIVYVLADAFGSYSLSNKFTDHLKASGIHFRFFSPFFSTESIYMGRRLHHKIAVADKRVALVGGINIADKYHGMANQPAWLDYAVSIKGEVCVYLHDLSAAFYDKKNFNKIDLPKASSNTNANSPLIRFRRNDWIRGKKEIVHSYRELITGAEHSITMVASYFVASYSIKKLLRKARQRGVEINIILGEKTDLPLFMRAEKHLYRFLFSNGIHVYEWPRSVMHGKAIIADNATVTIGSYNLNYLSHYRSIELNVDVKDIDLSREFSKHLDHIIEKECVKIDPENYLRTESFITRSLNAFAYFYLMLIMKVLLPKRK